MPQIQTDEKAYIRWWKRLKDGIGLRQRMADAVWSRLYDRWIGPRMRHCRDEQVSEAFAQYLAVVLPHLLGEEREVTATVTRVAAGEDADAKLQFAERLGDQATALARAVGLYQDSMGRDGELARAVIDAHWSMGILLFGFEAPAGEMYARGEAPGGEQREPELVDLDFARAMHLELNDAGMPFVRALSPLQFVGDATFQDFGQGQWCGIEYYLSLAEARALFPQYEQQLRPTHKSAPSWLDEGDHQAQESQGQPEGVVRFVDVYLRRPSAVLTLADERAGVKQILRVQELDLGIEGLPVLLLGGQWVRGKPYPRPWLDIGLDAVVSEDEFLKTLFGAGGKIKNSILVDKTAHPGLAAKIRSGEDQGVHEVDGAPKDAVHTVEVGAVRGEHMELARAARETTERNQGVSDMVLGKREPGDPNIPTIEARQAHVSARQFGLVRPVRKFEAAACQRLVAVAYAKLDLLHGMALPLGDGENARLAVFDASRPMIGELLDYAFTVEVSDRLSSADELGQLNNTVMMLTQLQPLLQAEGTLVRLTPLVESLLLKSRVPRAGEILLPGQAAPPMAVDPVTGQPLWPEQDAPAAGPPVAPEGATATQPGDPAGELEQLAAALDSVPEGDPAEDQILSRMAELATLRV